jgi:serine acetyltransferase/GT2 family glycosyltransferase
MISVVIATFNRGASLRQLLAQLAQQTLAPRDFEVIVVDDGSAVPAEEALAGFSPPYPLTLRRQANAGAAAARHFGATLASGEWLVFTDDDMRIPAHFLAAHLRLHGEGTRRFVLGRICADEGLAEMPLFERYHARMLDRFAADVASGRTRPQGRDVCTGNVSMRRADYLAVGGFDLTLARSEDAELGVRLERAGVEPVFSEDAFVIHASDHTSQSEWLASALNYGRFDLRIARKHAGFLPAHPLRFLGMVHPFSRPLLAAAMAAPGASAALSRLALAAATACDRLGAERAAISGTTLVYGLQYFRGVAQELGSARALVRELALFYSEKREPAFAEMVAAIHADAATMQRYDAKYHHKIGPRAQLGREVVEKIGLQMLVAYRLMRFFRASGRPLLAKIVSRLIRHLYGADIHWDAELAPGVMIVHGVGLVIGHSVRVGAGCILFQHVTLGEGIDPQTREVGSPQIGADVHIGPGASVIGPVMVGARCKITGGARLAQSVPEDSLVETAPPQVSVRKKRVS